MEVRKVILGTVMRSQSRLISGSGERSISTNSDGKYLFAYGFLRLTYNPFWYSLSETLLFPTGFNPLHTYPQDDLARSA